MLKRQLQLWGVKKLATEDVAKVLTHLYVEEEMSIADIARKFKSTGPGVRWLLEKNGIPIRLRSGNLLSKVKELKYRNLDDYFLKNALKSYKDMAEELGVSPPTVTRHYNLFLARRAERKQARGNVAA